MNICILARALPSTLRASGGMETHVHDLADQLASEGHSVTIIVSRSNMPAERVNTYGYRIYETPVTVTSNPLTRIRYYLDSRQIFASIRVAENIDVVHSQSNFAYGIMRECRGKNIPLAVTSHGTAINEIRTLWRSKRKLVFVWLPVFILWYFVELHLYRRADALIAVSPGLRDDIARQLGIDFRRIHVIPNGVDTGTFTPPTVESQEYTLLTVGQVNRQKGVDVAIRALARLKSKGHSVRLRVVGRGPYLSDLESLASELGVQQDVIFSGPVSRGEIPTVYRECSYFLFPTLREEAAPYVVLEAMAAARPVVASDIRSLRNVVRHQTSGLVAQVGDPDDLAEKIELLIRDPELAGQLGHAGRSLVVQKYSIKSMVEATIGVYREFGARRSSGTRRVETL